MNSRTHHHRAGFSLIEMIGVIAIMAIAAAVITPNVARRISRANGDQEDKMLSVLAEGLQRHVRTFQTIPGQNSWVTNIAAATGLAINETARVRPDVSASARVYLIHPSFTPGIASGGGFADPLWTQTSSGAGSVTNAHILIISSHKSSLTLPVSSGKAASVAAFENIWNWLHDQSTKAPPSGWPSDWTENGEYLHVQRVNLSSVFQRATFSNTQFSTNIPFARFNELSTHAFDTTNAVESFFLQGTRIRLYKHDASYNGTPPSSPDEMDIAHGLTADVNFVYENNQWRVP